MSVAIEPGMWVEYLGYGGGGCGPHFGLTPMIAAGTILCVEEVTPGWLFADGEDALVLREIPGTYPDGRRFAYDIRRFRPIYRPKQSLIEHLKQPAPADLVRA